MTSVEQSQTIAGLPFADYARYYDLLYRDKDYVGEADYVARSVKAEVPSARSILELGSGTGRHGRLLAAKGFDVLGIERSPEMVALAQAEFCSNAPGSFRCKLGDARSVALERRFDAVIALFHVVSYQTTDADLYKIFTTATQHLEPGGMFMFDVWHGPAVVAQPPEQRVKKVAADDLEVIRTARPLVDAERHTVNVTYDMLCRNRRTGECKQFSEQHLMRYLFPDEVKKLAASAGMRIIRTEEFMSGRAPSNTTWGIAYLLRGKSPLGPPVERPLP